MKKYYPVFLDLTQTKCLVVGGGSVAGRKVASLLAAGAGVTVISPRLNPELSLLAASHQISHWPRPFQSGDLAGWQLVFAATDDPVTNAQVAGEGRALGILVNAAEDPEQGNLILPAVLQRGPLSIAISTGGDSPVLARKIRQELAQIYGPEYGPYIELLGRERVRAMQHIADGQLRKDYFHRLTEAGLLELIEGSRWPEAEERIAKIWREINA